MFFYQEHDAITKTLNIVSSTQSKFLESTNGTEVRCALESMLLKSLVDSICQIAGDKSEVKYEYIFILNSEIVRLDVLMD